MMFGNVITLKVSNRNTKDTRVPVLTYWVKKLKHKAKACYSGTSTRLHPHSGWPLRVNEVFGPPSCCGAFCPRNASLNWGRAGRTLVVRVCVMAPPVALYGTSRGRLVAGRVTGDRRPPIRGIWVMSLPSVMGVGGLSLGLCTPPWMAVMGSGSTLTMVWWIMMMVVLSLPEE